MNKIFLLLISLSCALASLKAENIKLNMNPSDANVLAML